MSMADTAMPTVSPAPATSPIPTTPISTTPIPVSATLAANEAMARRRRAGQTVLPLAFGEAGLPVHHCARHHPL